MASLYNKFLDFIGIEEHDDPDDDREYYDDRRERDRGRSSRVRDYRERDTRDARDTRDRDYRDRDRERDRDYESGRSAIYRPERSEPERDNVVSMNSRASRRTERSVSASPLPVNASMKMVVYHPVSTDEARSIIDNLKNRKPVIVNLEEIDIDGARRILDFLSGAIYALSGTTTKISNGIFVFAPNECAVVDNGEDEEYEDDY